MMQTVAVRGQLKCGEKNVINTRVVLGIDIRFGITMHDDNRGIQYIIITREQFLLKRK
ncbi:hypothetical protein WUBG_02608 [Wuchereria bancrofti]|uniref:Uncharacterized protein n=1 Tax=Wuchereria bancrofti TaxID=6293 RepID=J9BGN8_WUCBA|nr:hypothetical protein WUBG_02608 [Wuchereria bancrofti]VDM07957.1 unnamed protein product [Wuchereria bancrofti]